MSSVRVELARVNTTDEDALRLLAAYSEELRARLGEPHPESRTWQAHAGARGRVMVARAEGRAIACAGLREHALDAAEIKHFYVEPSFRRRSVATALLEALEQEAKALGFRRIVLDTAAPLVEAARFYDRSGYARIAAYNANPRAAAWFDKKLPLDDASLWGAFNHSTLPDLEWTHRSHLRVAFMHLERWGLDEAHLRMRVGIIRQNRVHGLEETPERGYHETLTRVWLALVSGARRASRGPMGSEAFVAAHPELLDKKLPLRCYSRDLLMSLRARTVFVEPDLAPLTAALS
jgi:GNAT superfamily N-acetyltransferase